MRYHRHATTVVTGVIQGPDGHTGVRAVQVRCPWCRGTHQHTWHPHSPNFAYPTCGTPGVGYRITWPTNGYGA
jgi:hypothetical protein